MQDDNKTKKQLVHELTEWRSQNAELKKSMTGSISAELAVEEALCYAESIVETVREPLLILDADLKIISANRNFYSTFKVIPGETLGCFIYALGNKQWDIPKLRELLEEVLPEKQAFDDFEVDHDFQDVGHKIMLLNAREIYRKDICAKMILLAIEDITERRRLEDLLTESEERYRRLFETASDVIVLLEKREGKITHANPATEKMLGHTKKDSIGNKLQDIGVLLDMGDFQTTMQNLNKIGILNYDDIPVKTKSGQHIHTDIYLVDRAKLVQCNIRDITGRKSAEAALQSKNDELNAISQQLWQAAKLATMGELASSIAHELNNPLTTISLRIESLTTQTSQDDPRRRELEIIGQEVERMGNLITNILQFSRRSQAQISTVDVCGEIEKTFELIEYHLRKSNVKIIREFAPAVPNIQADRQQLRQLFLNLFTNAVDAMPEGGTLTVRVMALTEERQVFIEIADTGIGIPSEILPKVMEAFFTTKPEGKGTGLGLAICRRVAQEHHGTLYIVSEGIPGKGTRVCITLSFSNGSNAKSFRDE